MIRVPKPKPTGLHEYVEKGVKEVYCIECGHLVAWVSRRMQQEQPARARAMLAAAHLTDEECDLARSQAS